ncbi:right-handed parallel beta-helix repeat-containing protein, partial [Candidatus Dependentiae bacterium]|nr:right-handed parallel beta-helix repeat-containing protein [Candidatus Dependentiae bacterium]
MKQIYNFKFIIIFFLYFFVLSQNSRIEAGWTNIGASIANVGASSVVFGDYDNDGDLDIALSGSDSGVRISKIYRNDGTGTFTDISAGLVACDYSSLAWGDYDNDGDLDLAFSGYDGTYSRLIIYRNNGNHTFTNINEPMGVNAGLSTSSIQWADFDNDGLLDLAATGYDEIYARFIIFKNNGNSTFTIQTQPMGSTTGVSNSSIQCFDYDNDGDIDIAISGDNELANRFIIYRNNGDNTFTNVHEPMGANEGLVHPCLTSGDYNNDGYIDLVLTGEGSGNVRFIIYMNINGTGTFSNFTEPMGVNLGVTFASVKTGDYDNDGDLDIMVTGNDTFTILAKIYKNNGSGIFTDAGAGITGIEYGASDIGDYDNDGDLDFLVTGLSGGISVSNLYRNDGLAPANIRPAAPVLTTPNEVNFLSGSSVILQWSDVTTDTTPSKIMTYNVMLGTSYQGCQISASDSDSNDSVSNVLFGNVQNCTFAIFKNLPIGTYYWSVQAVDGGFMRSQWSASETFAVIPEYSGPKWYVSCDTGNNILNDGSEDSPYQTISKALSKMRSGDTVYIYAGTYSETITVDTDCISLIGADSNLTIIDPPGDSTVTSLNGIYAKNRKYLTVKKLRITECYRGIYFETTVDSALIEDVMVDYCGSWAASGGAFYFQNSDLATIKNCYLFNNWYGIYLATGCKNNNITNSIIKLNFTGISIQSPSSYNTFSNNKIIDNLENGCNVLSYYNTFSENLVSNNNYAFYFDSTNSYGNTLSKNQCVYNTLGGINFYIGSRYNYFIENNISYNYGKGIYANYTDNNEFVNNTIKGNSGTEGYGIYLRNSSNNYFSQNTVDSNQMYALYIASDTITSSTSNSDTFLRNNWRGSLAYPDSVVYNSCDTQYDFRYNYFYTSDSSSIASKIFGVNILSGSSYSVNWIPYRTSEIDTNQNVEFVAPAAPVFIDADTFGLMNIKWQKPSVYENGSLLSGAAPILGYRLYRTTNPVGISDWESYLIYTNNDAEDTDYVDTGITFGETYYYRIVSYNSHISGGIEYQNRSWYSDTKCLTAIFTDTSGPNNWYVNITTGDTNNSGLTEAAPKKYIRNITGWSGTGFLTTGDTINIAAGIYPETVVIGVNNIAIIGTDSSSTIIDPPGDSSVTTLYGIYANGKNNMFITNLKIKDCYSGIYFYNTDSSVIENNTIENCGNSILSGAGIDLYSSDSNIIRKNSFKNNIDAAKSDYSSSNTFSENVFEGNQEGVIVFTSDTIGVLKNTFLNSLNFGLNITNGTSCIISGNKFVDGIVAIMASNAETCIITNNLISNFNSGGLNMMKSARNDISYNTFTLNACGIYIIDTSTYNFVAENYITSNDFGILLQKSCSNTISANNVTLNQAGIKIDTSQSNIFVENECSNNTENGFLIQSSDYNSFSRNLILNNTKNGFYVYNSNGNMFFQNNIELNGWHAVYITGTSSSDIFQKNNFKTGAVYTDSMVYNASSNSLDFSYNYWTTTDSAVLSQKIKGAYSQYVNWVPYRTSAIDTFLGSDTKAPAVPVILSADSSAGGQIYLVWSKPVFDEDSSILTGISGYRLYRNIQPEADDWEQYLIFNSINSEDTDYIDTDIIIGQTYYYRVIAYDSHVTGNTVYYNRSWYSGIYTAVGAMSEYSGDVYYVSSSLGADTYNGSSGYPFRTITKALSKCVSGNTVQIAAGTYAETVVIDTDKISIIGADSSLTIIDPPGDSSVTTLYGIYANTKNNLRIENLRITDCYRGIFFDNVDSSVIARVAIDFTNNGVDYEGAIYLYNGSDSNFIFQNMTSENNVNAIVILNSDKNYISNNNLYNNISSSIWLNGSDSNYINDNICLNNLSSGITLWNSVNNIIKNNRCFNNLNKGFRLYNNSSYNILENNNSINNGDGYEISTSSNSNILQNNIADSNTGRGIEISSSSKFCTVYNNILKNNIGDGIKLISNVFNNTIDSNLVYSNKSVGIYLQSTNSNYITNNIIYDNSNNGFHCWISDSEYISGNKSYNNLRGYFVIGSNNCILINNIGKNNNSYGFDISSSENIIINNNLSSNNISSNGQGFYINSSNNIYFSQNTADSNFKYGFYISGTSSFDTFVKNNFIPSLVNPDFAVYNACDTEFDFRNNYWSTTDSAAIANKIKGTYSNKILWSPFRTTMIDTAIGADTVAPAAPSFVNADTSLFGQINLSWTKPALDENGVALGVGDSHFSGYRLYRAQSTECRDDGDTDDWEMFLIFDTNNTSDTDYTDTNIVTGETYYYRIVAYDSHITDGRQFYNRSWYSNIFNAKNIMSPEYYGPKWYVNDTSTVNDIFCISMGNNLTGNGSETFPFRSIEKALSMAKSWDTIFIDAGIYSETVVIDTDGISLIGADSTLTIIDPPGDSNITSLYGIYSEEKNNLQISNIKIIGCYYGMSFNSVNYSLINNLHLYENQTGVALIGKSYYLDVFGNWKGGPSSDNGIKNCFFFKNNQGIQVLMTSKNNLISDNIFQNNFSFGIYLNGWSDSNTVRNNIFNYSDGVALTHCSKNLIFNNISSNNKIGFYIFGSDSNILISNYSLNAANYVFFIDSSAYNYFAQNTVDSNVKYGFYIKGNSYSDIFNFNNWKGGAVNPDSAVYIAGDTYFDFRYNYWNISDSALIKKKIVGNGAVWSPFRTSVIDTAISADTVAPATPSFVSADTSLFGQINLRWTKPTFDENGISLGVGDNQLAGYRLYRVKSTECRDDGDTDDWEVFLIFDTNNTSDTDYTDTNIVAGETYYYRIISYDSHITDGRQFYNRSWYSGSYEVVLPKIISDIKIIYPSIVIHDTITQIITVSGTTANTQSGDTIVIYTFSSGDTSGIPTVNSIIYLTGINSNFSGTVSLSGLGDSIVTKLTNTSGNSYYDTINVNYYKMSSIKITYPVITDTVTQNVIVSGTTLNSLIYDTVTLYVNGVIQNISLVTGTNGSWSGTAALTKTGDIVCVKLTDRFGINAYDTI